MEALGPKNNSGLVSVAESEAILITDETEAPVALSIMIVVFWLVFGKNF